MVLDHKDFLSISRYMKTFEEFDLRSRSQRFSKHFKYMKTSEEFDFGSRSQRFSKHFKVNENF